MVQVPPSSHILGTQYFDEQMNPAVDHRLSLVLQLDSSTDTTISSSDDSATVLPDVFNVSGPMGPPLTIQFNKKSMTYAIRLIILFSLTVQFFLPASLFESLVR